MSAVGTLRSAPGLVPPDYDLTPFYDEAFDRAGQPRAGYADLLAAIAEAGPARLARRADASVLKVGMTFGPGRPFPVDPVPRLISASEWAWLERALAQRARALGAFLSDVYEDRRIVGAGVVPLHAIVTADHFEPAVIGVSAPVGYAPVVGFDLVRGADGRLRVLEDNLRTPSGLTYAVGVRRAMEMVAGSAGLATPPPLRECFAPLRRVLERAAGDDGLAGAALLTDGPGGGAWYEHRALARRLGLPVVTPEKLRLQRGRLCVSLQSGRLRELRAIYRRTNEDRLRDQNGAPTWLGEMLIEPLQRGRLSVVNAPGAGVADDKLIHAYVEDMVRFYLGQEPAIESVRSFDVTRPDVMTRVLGRLSGLVVKPRGGAGGHGIFISAQASPEDRAQVAQALRENPERFAAQETVLLSRHPTVAGDRLEPRHVDLRVFAIADGDRVDIIPCALTRAGSDRGSLIVNSAQGGGAKDTWLAP